MCDQIFEDLDNIITIRNIICQKSHSVLESLLDDGQPSCEDMEMKNYFAVSDIVYRRNKLGFSWDKCNDHGNTICGLSTYASDRLVQRIRNEIVSIIDDGNVFDIDYELEDFDSLLSYLENNFPRMVGLKINDLYKEHGTICDILESGCLPIQIWRLLRWMPVEAVNWLDSLQIGVPTIRYAEAAAQEFMDCFDKIEIVLERGDHENIDDFFVKNNDAAQIWFRCSRRSLCSLDEESPTRRGRYQPKRLTSRQSRNRKNIYWHW